MCVCVSRLSQTPQTLDELVESLKLLETLQGDVSKTESQIAPIQEQFAILEKYEVTVERDVSVIYRNSDNTHSCISCKSITDADLRIHS